MLCYGRLNCGLNVCSGFNVRGLRWEVRKGFVIAKQYCGL